MPDEIVQEHLLEHKWTLYYREVDNKSNSGANWAAQQKVLFTASTVEEFWQGWAGHIRSMFPQSDYSLFKDNIQPMWEDPGNARGGRWNYQFDNKSRNLIDPIWLDVLLLMVGEIFEPYNDNICGAVLSLRARGCRVAVWTSDASDPKFFKGIGETLKKEALKDGPLTYEKHDAGSHKRGAPLMSL